MLCCELVAARARPPAAAELLHKKKGRPSVGILIIEKTSYARLAICHGGPRLLERSFRSESESGVQMEQ